MFYNGQFNEPFISRLLHYNRHLLASYDMDSGKLASNFWPDYDPEHISEAVKGLTPVLQQYGTPWQDGFQVIII